MNIGKKSNYVILLALLMITLPTVGANGCAAIDIEKATNGVDADMAPGPSLFVGSSVEWTYVVENIGGVVLSNIEVTDNRIGLICKIGSLGLGESYTCTAIGIAESGQYDNLGTVTGEYGCGGGSVSDTDPSHYYGVCCPPGTGTPGYWKNHPDAWPVDEITIGGVTYPKEEAIPLMGMPVKGDKTITMFRALVAAKLNVLIGNNPTCIADTIDAADAWMATYGPVGSGVPGRSDAWECGELLYEKLDLYNNGELCALSRDELEDG